MFRLWPIVLSAVVLIGAGAQQTNQSGWRLPPTAAAETNPFPSNASVLAAGRRVFVSKCRRCHGPEGRGDGPDADHDHHEHMDLTSPARAAENPDGVVFHKVWNGRSSPKMPTFSEELSREQVWAVVAYVQSLRRRPTN